MVDSGWMTAHQAVLWIAFGDDTDQAKGADRGAWVERWGSPPSWCGTKHEVAWGLAHMAAETPIRDAHLARRLAWLQEAHAQPPATLARMIADDLAIYAAARQHEIAAETALQEAAARGALTIWGQPSDPASIAGLDALPDSELAPISDSVFATDGGGFRWLGIDTYGARILPGGFDPVWKSRGWTRLKVKCADIRRLWPARVATSAGQASADLPLNLSRDERAKKLRPLLIRAVTDYANAHRHDDPRPSKATREAEIGGQFAAFGKIEKRMWQKMWALPVVPENWRDPGRAKSKRHES